MSALIRLAAMPWLAELDQFSWLPEGWDAILDEAVSELDEVMTRHGARLEKVYVKEKLGSLRIQWVGCLHPEAAAVEVAEVVERAETRSLTACQHCGRPGRPSDGGLLVETLCEVHRLKRETR